MKRLSSVIQYVCNAKKRHGTHSPFVYDFADKCLSLQIDSPDKHVIKNYHAALKHNSQSISITDFGAGSKKLGNIRKIKDIYSCSQSDSRYGKLLYQLCKHYAPAHILELGTSLGLGTLMMHLGNPTAQIESIEGCPATHHFTASNFPIQSEQITFVNDTFEHYFTGIQAKQFDLIFIDGNHQGEALLRYIDQLLPYSHNDTIWILDDIRWSDDMWTTWNTIIQMPHFHVSIDLFRMGIIVERKEQFKEHFWIKQ